MKKNQLLIYKVYTIFQRVKYFLFKYRHCAANFLILKTLHEGIEVKTFFDVVCLDHTLLPCNSRCRQALNTCVYILYTERGKTQRVYKIVCEGGGLEPDETSAKNRWSLFFAVYDFSREKQLFASRSFSLKLFCFACLFSLVLLCFRLSFLGDLLLCFNAQQKRKKMETTFILF